MKKNIEELFIKNIDNYAHLSKIRKKLLSTDGKSKVSIMVGAGFSRNAAKIEDSFEGMALWKDLKNTMVRDLNNHKNIENRSVLEIGEVYSSEYGRSALDDLLKSLIPDENYEPTDLYNKLLNLPWADVYTTNYDTLLERSKASIYERNYQVVYDISDIPTSVQPRIVKLHGSFPANRPFVFTKKDYDEYPTKFSPFVNMVQQSIMESTFLLIGFSGDDPNFEKWTSWVRDNLKDHMPKIYMIGINEGEKQKQLEDKGITLIDFKDVYSSSYNYSQMFNDLFDYLSPKKEEEKTNWPFYKKINLENLKDLKENYPGWVVLPDKIRRDYYLSVDHMINYDFLLTKVKGNPLHSFSEDYSKDLEFPSFDFNEKITMNSDIIENLVNIIWFVSIFNIPISTDLEEVIKAAINSKLANEYQLNTFYLTLLKEKRIDTDDDQFHQYKILIDEQDIVCQDQHSYQYESIQYFIGNNMLEKAMELLNNWKVGEREPEWGVKKACLYLKLDKEDTAIDLFDKYLRVIRRLLAIKNNDYRLLSLESVILTHFKRSKGSDYAFERLKSLSLKDCHSEKEFTSTLRSVQNYNIKKIRQKNETFDPEIINTKVSIGSESSNYTLYESFAVSQINEQYQFSRNISKDDFSRIIIVYKNLKYIYQFYSFKNLVLLNDRKILNELFKRSYVVYLQEEFKDILIKLLEPSLTFDGIMSLIDDNNALDLYSRIYMRLIEDEKKTVYNKVLLALNKIYYNEFYLEKKVAMLTIKRICKSLDENELNNFIKALIDLKIPEDIEMINYYGEEVNIHSFFEPIQILFDRYYLKVNKMKIDKRTVSYLLDKLEHSKNISVQSIAFTRLLFLVVTKKINSTISKKSLNAIVNNLSEEVMSTFNELLDLSEYRTHGEYDFFNTKNRHAKFLAEYLSQEIPNYYEKNSNGTRYNSGNAAIYYFYIANVYFGNFESTTKSIILNREHYSKWLDKFYKWWDINKEGLLEKNDDRQLSLIEGNEILKHVMNALKYNVLSTIPLSYVRSRDKLKLEDIFNELLNVNNSYALSMIPLLERIKVGKKFHVSLTKILIDSSIEVESKVNGLNSLFLYISFFKKQDIILGDDEIQLILNELRSAISYSSGELLEEALLVFAKVIDFDPQLIDENYIKFSIKYLSNFLINLKNKINSSQESLLVTSNIELRLLSSHARLASILIKQKWNDDQNELDKWKEFIETHPLPEVKIHENNFRDLEALPS